MKYFSKPLRILDMCTGTGCIALTMKSLLNTFPGEISVTAIDIDPLALRLAKLNARNHGFNDIDIRWDNILVSHFNDLKISSHQFDIILSNPPYIPESEYLSLPKSVRDYESKSALVASENGTIFYRKIATWASHGLLDPNSQWNGIKMILEFGENMSDQVKSIVDKELNQYRRKDKLEIITEGNRVLTVGGKIGYQERII